MASDKWAIDTNSSAAKLLFSLWPAYAAAAAAVEEDVDWAIICIRIQFTNWAPTNIMIIIHSRFVSAVIQIQYQTFSPIKCWPSAAANIQMFCVQFAFVSAWNLRSTLRAFQIVPPGLPFASFMTSNTNRYLFQYAKWALGMARAKPRARERLRGTDDCRVHHCLPEANRQYTRRMERAT